MAFMSLTGWAADLIGSKFTISNVTYSEFTKPSLASVDGYKEGTDFSIDYDTWYTDEACTTQAKDSKGVAYTIDKLPVAKYWVKITGKGTYEGLTASASFNVIAIAATIEFTADQKKAWQAEEPSSYAYTLKKKGAAWTDTDNDLGLTVGRATGETVGTYAYTFNWTNKNYSLTRPTSNDGVKFAITAKDLTKSTTVTITALKTTMVYTGKNATGIYSVKDGETALVEGTDWTMADTKAVATGYTPTITFKGNYTGSKTPTTPFAITAAPITVSIDDIEKTYDATDQKDQTANAKFTYSGIVGDDVAKAEDIKKLFTAPTSVAVASAAINAGTYTLKITGGNNGTAANYYFKDRVDGKLTIKQKEVKIKAADATKNIGAADPDFTYVATPALVAGHKVTGITYTREKGETAGEYAITPDISAAKVIVDGSSDPVIYVTSNYALTVDETKGKLTIGKATITVIAKDAEKKYGATDPTFTYKAVGLVEGDPLTVKVTRAAGEAPGTYALTATASGYDATKYSGVTVVDGVFTVKPAQLKFTIPAQTVAVGADATALKKSAITVTGINNTDAAADLYDLSFNGVSTAADNTYPKGIRASLKATTVKVDGTDVAITKLYEIVDNDGALLNGGLYAEGKLIVGTGGGAAITDLSYAQIKDRAGETISSVALSITGRNSREVPTGTAHPWAAMTWNTMVLPFEVSVRELSAQLGYAIVNRVDATKTTEDNVIFKLEMDKIPANEPFCVKTDAAIENGKGISFKNKLIVDGGEYPSVDAGQGYKFVGAYKAKTLSKITPDLYFLRGDNNKWAHIGASSDNSWTVVPFDAYIDQSSATSGARELTFTFQELDGSYTAIRSIAADKNNEGAAKTGWYTIGGMKLQSAPVQKGVYIKDGKKVIVK